MIINIANEVREGFGDGSTFGEGDGFFALTKAYSWIDADDDWLFVEVETSARWTYYTLYCKMKFMLVNLDRKWNLCYNGGRWSLKECSGDFGGQLKGGWPL